MSTENDDERAIEIIRSSGLLNENVTLGQLMDVSAKLGDLDAVGKKKETTFIYKHFIYTTSGLTQGEVINPAG
jgi:hypothetical protein